jgi:hypothetical protein
MLSVVAVVVVMTFEPSHGKALVLKILHSLFLMQHPFLETTASYRP